MHFLSLSPLRNFTPQAPPFLTNCRTCLLKESRRTYCLGPVNKHLYVSHEFLITPVTLDETSLGETQDELSVWQYLGLATPGRLKACCCR